MEKLFFEIKDWKVHSYFSFSKLKDWKYSMQEVKKIRSIKSNRYYWWYFLKYILLQYKDCWYIYTKDNLHEIFKKAFAPRKREYSDFSKKHIQKIWSTADMTDKQFSDYIKLIWVMFEFWEMEKLWLEQIPSFVVPEINEDELIYRENQIV
jgi:hypothetical protein